MRIDRAGKILFDITCLLMIVSLKSLERKVNINKLDVFIELL